MLLLAVTRVCSIVTKATIIDVHVLVEDRAYLGVPDVGKLGNDNGRFHQESRRNGEEC